MKLLEKESIDFYLERAWTVLRYAFFKDEEYDGLNSHQEDSFRISSITQADCVLVGHGESKKGL